MILAEPPPSQGDLHFSLFGFPVRIHPLFWLSSLMLSDLRADPIFVVMWIVAVILCILLHEMGHALVMQIYGFSPSIVLYSFGGLAIPHTGRYGVRRPGPWGDMLIAIAGPLSGFLLAGLLVLVLHFVVGYPLFIFASSWRDVVPLVIVPNLYVTLFLHDLFYITVMWGLLNLLPIYPLDGGQIAQQIFFLANPRDAIRPSLILSVIVAALMAAISLMHWQNSGQHWQDFYLVVFFGWLGYSNYTALQSYHQGWH